MGIINNSCLPSVILCLFSIENSQYNQSAVLGRKRKGGAMLVRVMPVILEVVLI